MSQSYNQQLRPYKIEVYNLQDDYVGSLQSYNDQFIGQIIDPILEISTDGTQKFTCSIPKYIIDVKTNQKILNPRWQDIDNNLLVENTRILKVFIKYFNETKIFPLMIDNIAIKRNSHFAVYKEVEAHGLAFSELGKIGYKLSLDSSILEKDYELDSNTTATINYWLDKVFPNEKDEGGKIIKWLTPWCYEIRMEWETVSGQTLQSDKIYDPSYVDSWGINKSGTELVPLSVSDYQEKARYIDCKNSNKYNITQTIAETFEVFCTYEYKCSNNGSFIGNYIDEQGRHWTGRKVIFYNKAINMNDPLTINYQKNLKDITRTIDSSEIYTKMYVQPINSSVMTNGMITIADTPLNPLMDDFILNFDYLHSTGAINDEQLKFIKQYEASIRQINDDISSLSNSIIEKDNKITQLETELSSAIGGRDSAQEVLKENQILRDNDTFGDVILGGESGIAPANAHFTVNNNRYESQLAHKKIDISTLAVYSTQDDASKLTNQIFSSPAIYSEDIDINSNNEDNKNIDKFFIITDEYECPITIITSLSNPVLSELTIKSLWLTYTYTPKNYYIDICNAYEAIITRYSEKIERISQKLEILKPQRDLDNQLLENKRKEKDNLNFQLENYLGPALREGYWAAKDYEDPGQKRTSELGIISHEAIDNEEGEDNDLFAFELADNSEVVDDKDCFYFSNEPEDTEEKGWFYKDESEKKTYYSYIPIKFAAYKEWHDYAKDLSELIIYFQRSKTTPLTTAILPNEDNPLKYYKIIYNQIDYYFKIEYSDIKDEGFDSYIFQEYENQIILTLKNSSKKIKKDLSWITYEKIPEDKRDAITVFDLPSLFKTPSYIFLNSGFTFGFLKNANTKNNPTDGVIFGGLDESMDENKNKYKYMPVIIFNDPSVLSSLQLDSENGNLLRRVSYSFSNSKRIKVLNHNNGNPLTLRSLEKDSAGNSRILGYPRIKIQQKNVLYESDTLKLSAKQQVSSILFNKYEDYQIILKELYPTLLLKLSKNQDLYKILNYNYFLEYKISRANELLYKDAVKVAYDSSRPKYSYNLTVTHFPNLSNKIELGQLIQINDYSVGLRCETGYINQIKFNLNQPNNDEIVVQDYTTKFEDLFAQITATNETIKQNQGLYNAIAANFTSSGQIDNTILQTVFNNNSFSFDYSKTAVEINPTEGIILTNLSPYDNGIYGQVILKGGGIFLSNKVDANNNRIWSQAITPNGINAAMINTGVLDTNLIRICSGNDLAFKWDAEGLIAYKRDENNKILTNTYIKYSSDGLHFVLNENNTLNNCSVELGWEGLKLTAQSGALTLTAKDGLQIFYPETQQGEEAKKALQIGRWNNGSNDTNIINYYGLRLFDTNGNETFTVDNSGNLMITGTMQSGRFASGILGYGWRINNDGTAEFQDVHIRGTISASVFEYKETTAIGGELYIGPTLIVDYNKAKEAKITYTEGQLILDVDLGFANLNDAELCGRAWAENDVLGINCCLINSAGNKYEIKNLRMRLVAVDDTIERPYKLVSSTLWDTSLNALYNEDGSPIQFDEIDWEGLKISGPINCIFIGTESGTAHNRKGILLTAMAANGPYIDIQDDINGLNVVEGIAIPPKVRLGCLDDLKTIKWIDKYGSELSVEPKGYGLYSDNVYLTGTIYATSGKIGSLSIDEVVNKHLNIIPDLGDMNNFIINKSNVDYKPTLYPKLLINNSQLGDNYPDEINKITYTIQWLSKAENSEWKDLFDGSHEWTEGEGSREHTFQSATMNDILTHYYRVVFIIEYKNNKAEETLYSPVYSYTTIENSIQYKLVPNTTSVVRDLQESITPKQLIFTINQYTGNNIKTDIDKTNFDLVGKIHTDQSSEDILVDNFKANIESYTDIMYKFLTFELKLDNETVDILTIPFELGDRLRALGTIQNNQVILAKGTVYAESIAACQVTAGKIAAGAIQTGGIASDSNLFLLSGVDMRLPQPDDQDENKKYIYWNSDGTFNSGAYDKAVEGTLLSAWNEIRQEPSSGKTGILISPNSIYMQSGRFEVNSGVIKLAGIGSDGQQSILNMDDKVIKLSYGKLDNSVEQGATGELVEVTIDQNGLNAKDINVENLQVTNLKFNNSLAQLKYGYIYSNDKPQDANNILWIKPIQQSDSIINKQEIKIPTKSSRGGASCIWNGTSFDIAPVEMPILSEGTSYEYTLTIPTVNIANASGICKDLKNINLTFVLTFQKDTQNSQELTFTASGLEWASWEKKNIVMTLKSQTKNYFSSGMKLTKLTSSSGGQSNYQLYIEANSSISLVGKALGTDSTDTSPIECKIYYIP